MVILMLAIGFFPVGTKASVTIATFDDQSTGSSDWLFKVDFTQMTFTGGWADTKPGLTLEISGVTFKDVWFEMSPVTITSTTTISGVGKFGQINSGEISFYADGTTTSPLLTISFGSGLVSRYGFGESDETPDGDIVAANVTIAGSAISGTLSEEQFSFGFANLAKLTGHTNLNDGFTATAAFASSATVSPGPIPEPATICILGIGALCLIRGKKR